MSFTFKNKQRVLIKPEYHISMFGTEKHHDVIGNIVGVATTPMAVLGAMWIVEVEIPGYEFDCIVIPGCHIEAYEEPLKPGKYNYIKCYSCMDLGCWECRMSENC